MTDTRTLGLLGGMAWPSTEAAYRLLNQRVNEARGGLASPRLVLWSADFAEIEELQRAGDWAGAGALLADAARGLVAAGAEGLALLTNTMHRVAPAVERAVDVPLLHVADATAAACRSVGADVVGLLGTRFTMEEEGVRDRLAAHRLEVRVPPAAARTIVHDHIYGDLVHGRVTDTARDDLRRVAAALAADGATAVIAGCTEIELALTAHDVGVPYVPTTATLMDVAVAWLLGAEAPPGPPTD